FNFVGFIDRLDEIHEGRLRVCDYKTGKVTDADRDILNGDVEKVAAVFGPVNKDRPKIALQLFIYNMLLRRNGYKEPLSDSIYQMASLFKDKPAAYPMDAEVYKEMEKCVEETLREMEDLSVPFRRTEELETCEWCDFKMLCGR
ncbi:MAG: PD-(D/E)XK nuclease family protein, partial [Bacteroidales bacterium]|nr:PD-(D/E)XK nuclease family protein [Bacteroidales bacterium]